jgi:histidinol-phosphate aminotransferase
MTLVFVDTNVLLYAVDETDSSKQQQAQHWLGACWQRRCGRLTIRQDVTSMHAYAIQPSAGMVKLDAMENPFRPAARTAARTRRAAGARVAINRYPASQGRRGGALAALRRLPAGCKLILGNGSDELIDILSVACNVPGATLLAPLPGFVMYEMSARLRGLRSSACR